MEWTLSEADAVMLVGVLTTTGAIGVSLASGAQARQLRDGPRHTVEAIRNLHVVLGDTTDEIHRELLLRQLESEFDRLPGAQARRERVEERLSNAYVPLATAMILGGLSILIALVTGIVPAHMRLFAFGPIVILIWSIGGFFVIAKALWRRRWAAEDAREALRRQARRQRQIKA